MPSVGERKVATIGDMSRDPMYEYAAKFFNTQQNILNESHINYAFEPGAALGQQANIDALREFFTSDAVLPVVDHSGNVVNMESSQYQDELSMMNEVFANDVQAIRENAVAGLATYNPMIGLSLPMHKYLMLNCVFAQALPRFVAKSPMWTESIETRYIVDTDGRKYDVANQQHMLHQIMKKQNPAIEVPIVLPEAHALDILDTYFRRDRVNHNLSVATCIDAVAVEDYAEVGDTVLTISTNSTTGLKEITESKATTAGVALVWKPWRANFTPGYGDANRVIVQPITLSVTTDGTTETVVNDMLFASQKENLFDINTTSGVVKAVRMHARYDASLRNLRTPKVEWGEKTIFVQIPESDGITIPVTPEEVKDVGALYGINQVTKYMSIMRDVLENDKDDTIKEFLDDSFMRLDDDHRLAKMIDFAPRRGYHSDHLEWIQKTFMNTLDHFVTGLLTVLRDPNMQVNIIGRPEIIRQITPIEYTYQTPNNLGPIELDFRKTVVTSDKRVYNFISSEKLWGTDTLIVLLIPKNTNRIVYRLYDYQMYISNEIRDAQNPQLPALTTFQRYLPFELFGVQGRLGVANPTGLTHFYENKNPLGYDPTTGDKPYAANDLGSVYTFYDEELGRNVTAEEAAVLAKERAAASTTTDPDNP